jgi:hypothetical protein
MEREVDGDEGDRTEEYESEVVTSVDTVKLSVESDS